MKTTIDIPEPLYKQAKICAIERGQTLKAILLKGLEREIQPSGKASNDRPATFTEKRKLRPDSNGSWLAELWAGARIRP